MMRSAASVVPPGEVTCGAQLRQVGIGRVRHLARAVQGRRGQALRGLRLETERGAGLGHQLREQEEVRRPAAGERGDRIQRGLAVHPDHVARRPA